MNRRITETESFREGREEQTTYLFKSSFTSRSALKWQVTVLLSVSVLRETSRLIISGVCVCMYIKIKVA